MSDKIDQNELLRNQYATSANLNARIALHNRFGGPRQRWSNWILDRVTARLPKDARLLEIGCGPGYLWCDTCDRVPTDWRITLTDFSIGMLVEAGDNLAECRRQFDFAVADAARLPFQADQFDAVVANHMLYHVLDRPAAFAGIRRALKPGGTLFATTNSVDQYMPELRAIERRFHIPSGFGPMGKINFNLENGREQLEPFFADIELTVSDSELRVTEGAPVINYMTSYPSAEPWSPETMQDLRSYLDAEIQSKGALTLTKRTGMFVARTDIE